MNTIGKRITYRIDQLGLVRKTLALNVGMTPRMLRYIEEGTKEPSISFVIPFARELQTTTNYILGETTNPDMKFYPITKTLQNKLKRLKK